MEIKRKGLKFPDTDQNISAGSRADFYWMEKGFNSYYKFMRPGLKLPASLAAATNNIDKVLDYINIGAVGFGKWVTIEERYNYTNAMIVSFYDLNKILRFDNNIGINKLLRVTFGARGAARAAAHFEPHSNIINITRYAKPTPGIGEEKDLRFLTTGGISSFAHEYGHFLDYFAGRYLCRAENGSLTGGRITEKARIKENHHLVYLCNNLMEKILWKGPGVKSAYHLRLLQVINDYPGIGEYFNRRNEIFARAFEAFVTYELKNMGVKNLFLSASKYNELVYLSPAQIKVIAPLFRSLISEIRANMQKFLQ